LLPSLVTKANTFDGGAWASTHALAADDPAGLQSPEGHSLGHSASPAPVLYLPGEHAAQLSSPSEPVKVPAGQLWQSLEPTPLWYVPFAHSRQSPAETMPTPLWYVPFGHSRHDPPDMYDPAWHWSTQVVVPPLAYLDAGHAAHAAMPEPSTKYVSCPQHTLDDALTQRLNPLAQVPVQSAQSASASDPAALNFPFGQTVHNVPAPEYVPAGHDWHSETRITTMPEPPLPPVP